MGSLLLSKLYNYSHTCILVSSMIKNCAFPADETVAWDAVKHEHLVRMLSAEGWTM